jgi:hypothetical protein
MALFVQKLGLTLNPLSSLYLVVFGEKKKYQTSSVKRRTWNVLQLLKELQVGAKRENVAECLLMR